MNREIKFRAWDEGNKVMHYDFQFIKSVSEGNDWIIFTSDKQPLDWERIRIEELIHPFNNPYFQQQLHIMQFTGLKDKNGKEIYEGDIVNCIDHPTGFESSVGFVHCNNARWRVTWSAMSLDEYGSQWIEVIGNIYENPELLNN